MENKDKLMKQYFDDQTCIICHCYVNAEDLYDDIWCECIYIVHKKCFKTQYKIDFSCINCKEIYYRPISYKYYKDYEKAKIIFDAMKTNNCPCTIHHKKISKFIILKQYNEFPNNINMHHINLDTYW